jgi:hypothetical protein
MDWVLLVYERNHGVTVVNKVVLILVPQKAMNYN